MTKETIEEGLIVVRGLLENLLLGKVDKHDRLDIRQALLPRKDESVVLVQLDSASGSGEESADDVPALDRRHNVHRRLQQEGEEEVGGESGLDSRPKHGD